MFSSTHACLHDIPEEDHNGWQRKEEYGFILTKTPTPDGRWPIRISTPLWITPGHIDQLVDAMQDLAKKMN